MENTLSEKSNFRMEDNQHEDGFPHSENIILKNEPSELLNVLLYISDDSSKVTNYKTNSNIGSTTSPDADLVKENGFDSLHNDFQAEWKRSKRTKNPAQDFQCDVMAEDETSVHSDDSSSSPQGQKQRRIDFTDQELIDEKHSGDFFKFPRREYSSPVQEDLKRMIMSLEMELLETHKARESELLSEEDSKNKITKLLRELDSAKLKLKKRIQSTERQKRHRYRSFLKKTLRAGEQFPEANVILQSLEKVKFGRPQNGDDQAELIRTIIEMAVLGRSIDVKQKSKLLKSCKTFDDVCRVLEERGIFVSPQSSYLRLIPECIISAEEKRNVATVPVKLFRPRVNCQDQHPDRKFCSAIYNNLQCIASVLGPNQCCFISKDERAEVLLGITAFDRQAPILTRVDYHQSPILKNVHSSSCKLLASVYAPVEIKSNSFSSTEGLTYFGPTYIALKSESSIPSGIDDFNKVLNHPSFENFCKTPNRQVKPVVIMIVDWNQATNPVHKTIILNAISEFKNFDLDAMFILTNAPGDSASKYIERKLAPLSRSLVGLILPYHNYGTHLDSKGRTSDEELEKTNLKLAGETLADIWQEFTLDGYEVFAEYVSSNKTQRDESTPPSVMWYDIHVRESEYFIQISKCVDDRCCKSYRSSLLQLLPERFLSAPIPVKQSESKFIVPHPKEVKDEDVFAPLLFRCALPSVKAHEAYYTQGILPYDLYCPSVADVLISRTCSICGLYFVSHESALKHACSVHNLPKPLKCVYHCRRMPCDLPSTSPTQQDTQCLLENALHTVPATKPTNKNSFPHEMPVINNIAEWLEPTWLDDI